MTTPKVCVEDFEEQARKAIDEKTVVYYRSGAGEQFTLSLNREAFRRLRIRPRCLRDVSHRDTTRNILGYQLQWPVGISPTALQKMAHPDGEGGNAKAAGEMGSIFILATLSTMSIEEVANVAPDTCKWFQLYVYRDRSFTEKFLRRLEKANFKAIVLSVDVPVFGLRWDDIRNKFKLPSHLHFANFEGQLSKSAEGASSIYDKSSDEFDDTQTWKYIEWLRKQTHLPIIVKGILTAEDAILAREAGCAGVIVSNHGARQLDGVPATIEALPEIVKAVGNDLTVMLDGGIRHGNDIFKALALGAKMVFVGRPALWGLGSGGYAGVKEMLQVLKNDFDITLALTGCQKLSDIQPNMVMHESQYARL